jgi:phosphoribosylformylglycinamidine cyclo-ligase
MVVVVAASEADAVAWALREAGEAPLLVGDIVRADDGQRVRTRGALKLT